MYECCPDHTPAFVMLNIADQPLVSQKPYNSVFPLAKKRSTCNSGLMFRGVGGASALAGVSLSAFMLAVLLVMSFSPAYGVPREPIHEGFQRAAQILSNAEASSEELFEARDILTGLLAGAEVKSGITRELKHAGYYNLFHVYARLREWQKAWEALLQAYALDDDHVPTLENLKWLSQMMQIHPKDPPPSAQAPSAQENPPAGSPSSTSNSDLSKGENNLSSGQDSGNGEQDTGENGHNKGHNKGHEKGHEGAHDDHGGGESSHAQGKAQDLTHGSGGHGSGGIEEDHRPSGGNGSGDHSESGKKNNQKAEALNSGSKEAGDSDMMGDQGSKNGSDDLSGDNEGSSFDPQELKQQGGTESGDQENNSNLGGSQNEDKETLPKSGEVVDDRALPPEQAKGLFRSLEENHKVYGRRRRGGGGSGDDNNMPSGGKSW